MKCDKIEVFARKCLESKPFRVFLFGFSIVSIFMLLLFLNIKTPILGDDLSYFFIFNSTERIQNLNDLILSQYEHYNTWGGRVVVHSIAQVLLLLDPLQADILNSLAFVALILLTYLHINYKKPFSVSLLIGVFLLILFLEPFSETTLWITGSANYLWGTVIILSFMLPYRFYANKKSGNFLEVIKLLLMFIFGFIAGWTNENTGAALILMLVLFMLSYRSNKWSIPLWAYSGLLGALLGYSLMIIAPGNAVRAAGTETNLFLIAYRLLAYTRALLNQLGLLNLALGSLFIILYRMKGKDAKSFLCLPSIYILGMLAGIYVMLFSPAFPERAWFGVIVFNIIALGLVLVNLDSVIIRNFKYAFIGLGLLVFIFNAFTVYKDVTVVDQILKERDILFRENKDKGAAEIEQYRNKTKYSMADPTYSEHSMSTYYGMDIKYRDKK